MVGRPACRCRLDAYEAEIGQIERVDKSINHPNRIALLDPLIEALRQQRRLSAMGTLNKALHELPPANRQANHSREAVFTQPGSKPDSDGRSGSGAKRKFGQMAMSAKCHDHEERSLGDENALQAPNDELYHPDYFRCSLW